MYVDGSFTNAPKHVPGAAKYRGFRGGSKGLYKPSSFGTLSTLNPRLVQVLVNSANNGIAESTWGQYHSVRKHLERCQKSTGQRFTFPMDQNQTLRFIAFLFDARNLKALTVSKILSGLRMIHLTEGHPEPSLRPAIVKLILKGKANYDEEEARSLPKRLAVTIKVLELLKISLQLDKSRSEKHKKLVWAVSCIAFNGCMRIGELLSSTSRTIDPLNCLLKKDIWLSSKIIEGKRTEMVNIRLKSSKESRNDTRGIIIEVYANESSYCPVKSWKQYISLCGRGKIDTAAFRTPMGWAYRKAAFNNDLRDLLGKYITYGKISGHSFRAGLASLMAQAGYKDESIMAIGRWSSTAFKDYIKLGRVTRVAVASRLASLMN